MRENQILTRLDIAGHLYGKRTVVLAFDQFTTFGQFTGRNRSQSFLWTPIIPYLPFVAHSTIPPAFVLRPQICPTIALLFTTHLIPLSPPDQKEDSKAEIRPLTWGNSYKLTSCSLRASPSRNLAIVAGRMCL